MNCVSSSVYEYIEECDTYDSAKSILEKLYVKTPNVIFSRHLLATRKQKPGESLDEFLREVRKLSKDCWLKAVSAEQYREELIRNAFINGLASPLIRQRLLENDKLDLQSAYNQTYSLDLAHKNAEAYNPGVTHTTAAINPQVGKEENVEPNKCDEVEISENPPAAATFTQGKKCYFCGENAHARNNCPAREAICHKCGKPGHFACACKSKSTSGSVAMVFKSSVMATKSNIPQGLDQAATAVTINGKCVNALVDSCSTESYISEKMAKELGLKIHPSSKGITMAQKSLNTTSLGFIVAVVININNYITKER